MQKYHIGPDPARIDPALIEGFSAVEVATLGHFRQRGFVDHRLRPLAPLSGRLVGTAVTVAIPGTDSTLLHHAIASIRPGDVLVIDRLGDRRHACLGGGVALAAKVAGALAVVLDGPCTDPGEILECGLPVFCDGVSGITTRLNDLGGSLNKPVSVGNVPVMPGDVVIMDECGVLILPPDEAPAVLAEGVAREARAGRNRPRVEAGEPLGELSGASAMVRKAVGGPA